MKKFRDMHIGTWFLIAVDGSLVEFQCCRLSENTHVGTSVGGKEYTVEFSAMLETLMNDQASGWHIVDWFEEVAVCQCSTPSIMIQGCTCGAVKRYGT